MNDDHLSPEPLSTYHEIQAQENEPTKQPETYEDLDVAGAFTKIELEKQKRELEAMKNQNILTPSGQEYSEIKSTHFQCQTKQLNYRNKTLSHMQDKARNDFNIVSEGKNRGLER